MKNFHINDPDTPEPIQEQHYPTYNVGDRVIFTKQLEDAPMSLQVRFA